MFGDIIPHIPEACGNPCECLCLPCEVCNCDHRGTVEITNFADPQPVYLCVRCGEAVE